MELAVTHETAATIRKKLLDQLQSDEQAAAIVSTPRNNECPICQATGWVRIVVDKMECVSRCQCQKNKILDRKLSVIPSRYRDAHFGNYKPIDDVEGKALEKLSSDTFGSFFLYGDYGRGKTHLLIAQYRRVAKLDRPAMLFTMAELLCELRRVEFARFGTMADSEYVSLVIDRVKYSERFHLFLDDIDKFKVTEFKFEVLFDLLDTIWKRKLQLTVTSNYSLTDLIEQERLHPAIVRRIDDICQAVEV